eukprot:707722_1
MEAQDKNVRTLRNHCVNHKIDLDVDKKGTDAEILNELYDILKVIRKYWAVADHYRELIKQCMSHNIKLKCIPKDFDLRWLRFMNDALSNVCHMLDVYVISCIRLLRKDNSDEETYLMLQLLVENYFTFLRVNKTIEIYAILNNFGENESRTVIDWVDKVDITLQQLQRLKDGGVIAAISSRIRFPAPPPPPANTGNRRRRRGSAQRSEPQIVSPKLQFIVDAIESINDSNISVEHGGPIEFDPLFTESHINETLLTYYVDFYADDYTNIDTYRQWAKIINPKKFDENVNTHVNDTVAILLDVTNRYQPDIDGEEICAEYEREIRDLYLHNSIVRNVDYYDHWSMKMNEERFKEDNPNLYSLIFLIWSIIYSNSTVEKHVHISNLYRNKKRNLMSIILLDCLLHIFYNGPSLVEVSDLLAKGIDLWQKIGGMSVISEFSAKDIPVCIQNIDQFYKAASVQDDATMTDYQKRKNRRDLKYKQNGCMMKGIGDDNRV